jgi:hypothetical protein
MSEGDATLGHVIRREFQGDLVACQDAYVVHAHLASGISHEFVTIVQSDTVTRVREHLADHAGTFPAFLLWTSSCLKRLALNRRI